MKSYDKLVNESSSRLKSKFIKYAEPKAKMQGFVAHYAGDSKGEDKANRTLKLISKVRSKLYFPKPVYESTEESLKQQLLHHVTNSNPTSENVTMMHDIVHSLVKHHGASADSLYKQIQDNEVIHKKFREAASE